MLHSLSSRELTKWQAYERLHGPLDDSWRDEHMAVLIEMLQYNTYITGAVGQGKKNPAPKPKPITRPWEMYEQAKKEASKVSRFSDESELILEEGEVNPF